MTTNPHVDHARAFYTERPQVLPTTLPVGSAAIVSLGSKHVRLVAREVAMLHGATSTYDGHWDAPEQPFFNHLSDCAIDWTTVPIPLCGNRSPATPTSGLFICALPQGHGYLHNACDHPCHPMLWTHPQCKGCGLELDGALLAEYQLSSSDKPYCAACYTDRERARAVETGSVVYGIGNRIVGKTRGSISVDPIVVKFGTSLDPGEADRIGRLVRAELEKMMGLVAAIPADLKIDLVVGTFKCRRCSGCAARDGFCEYCYGSAGYSGPAERDAVIAKCADSEERNIAARARNEAALAAERPLVTKSSREAAKPHPWSAWSTAGDES